MSRPLGDGGHRVSLDRDGGVVVGAERGGGLGGVLCPLVISAPFGNYVRAAGATSTLGTFTAARRRGRLWRIIKTVRYSPTMRAWTNKIGLRNPGIDWLCDAVGRGRVDVSGSIVSIHGFTDADWWSLLEKACSLRPMAIELNMSCPNVGEVSWPDGLFERALSSAAGGREERSGGSGMAGGMGGVGVVVKLPPVNYREMFEVSLGAGVRAFHCCNTLPVPMGGLSGKPLKPVSLQCLRDVRERSGGVVDEVVWIGGGGITTAVDIDDYVSAGATHVAIGTKAFDPRLLLGDGPVRGLIEHARLRLGRG